MCRFKTSPIVRSEAVYGGPLDRRERALQNLIGSKIILDKTETIVIASPCFFIWILQWCYADILPIKYGLWNAVITVWCYDVLSKKSQT